MTLPGTFVRYFAEGQEGLLLVHDSATHEEPIEIEGPEPEAEPEADGSDPNAYSWATIIDLDGWAFRPGHDGARWVTGVPHVSDPSIEPERDTYWREIIDDPTARTREIIREDRDAGW